jgi:hypothetical protein
LIRVFQLAIIELMIGKETTEENLWVTTPYYDIPTSRWSIRSRTDSVNTLQNIGNEFRDPDYLMSGNTRFAVIDDGANLSPEEVSADTIIHLPQNAGKAEAIRAGLSDLLARPDAPDWILQIDADGDQVPEDYRDLLREARKVQDNYPDLPVLCIGNRYTGELVQEPFGFNPHYPSWQEAMRKKEEFIAKYQANGQVPGSELEVLLEDEYRLRHQASEDSLPTIRYRRAMLLLQRALSIELARTLQGRDLSWTPTDNVDEEQQKIMDWASGARVYNKKFAELFLENSQSERYGIEAEQIVLAYLTDTYLLNVGIKYSRHRDPDTDGDKLVQMLKAIFRHEQSLEERGAHHITTLLHQIENGIRSNESEFILSLLPLGYDSEISFKRSGQRITAEADYNLESSVFKGGVEYPWDLVTDQLPR